MLIRFISGIKFVIYKAFNKISSYGDWEVTLKIYFGNTKYWLTIIELESILFIFIKNFRPAHSSFFCYRFKRNNYMYVFLLRSYTVFTMKVDIFQISPKNSTYVCKH